MSSGLADGSRLAESVRGVQRAIGGAYRESILKRGVDRIEGRLRSVANRIETTVRNSWIFQWLTAEPDPEVIVIDLRETYTAGPVVRVIDRAVPHIERAWHNSVTGRVARKTRRTSADAPVRVASALVLGFLAARLALTWPLGRRITLGIYAGLAALAVLGLTVDWTLTELAESRVGQLVRVALEPPEPPEDADERSSSSPRSASPHEDAAGASASEPSVTNAPEDADEQSSSSPRSAPPHEDADRRR
ncbi:hypothetical protein [Halomicrobium salinisoli]|uniref:hypothetical protein n=1 Tax=Halomicrobium salinisoli TaxID=2878391 RepID=UPI001CF035BF|nr:hypothetical protein [Halomicrobium salinisoli]